MNLTSSTGRSLLNVTSSTATSAGLSDGFKGIAIVFAMFGVIILAVGGVCSAIMHTRGHCHGMCYWCSSSKDSIPVFDSGRAARASTRLETEDDDDTSSTRSSDIIMRPDELSAMQQRMVAWDQADAITG